jgi:hypothetical protein
MFFVTEIASKFSNAHPLDDLSQRRYNVWVKGKIALAKPRRKK